MPLLVVGNGIAAAAQGPTVREIVEFTRLVTPSGRGSFTDQLNTQVSPDRRHAFVVTRRSNVDSDSNRFEVLLLDIEPARLETGRIRAPEVLFGFDSLIDRWHLDPPIQQVRWVDNTVVAFLARLHNSKELQAYSIDIHTRRLVQLTFSDKEILSFGISTDLKQVVYAIREHSVQNPADARSFVVGNTSLTEVLFKEDVRRLEPRYRYFALRLEPGAKPVPLGEAFHQLTFAPPITVSPDGKWAVLKFREADRAREIAWAKRYPAIRESFEQFSLFDVDPLQYFSQSAIIVTTKLMLFRLADGNAQPVLDAPDGDFSSKPHLPYQFWGTHGDSVILANTFLPVAEGRATNESTRAHVIEYWPESGRRAVIARLDGVFGGANPATRDGRQFVLIDGTRSRRFHRNGAGRWEEVVSASTGAPAPRIWTLDVDEAADLPPDIVAIGPSGQRAKLTHLNPQFSPSTWGVTRPYTWKDRAGREWDGGLITPNELDPSVRYPLIIQTYGFDPRKFYLYGPRDASTSAFAGRAFLREGFVVLAFPTAARGSVTGGDRMRDHILQFMDGVSSAIASLVKQGVVDESRVGIIGFSATGNDIAHLLAFGDASIRAATIADSWSSSLAGTTTGLFGWAQPAMALAEQAHQAQPFGNSVAEWTARDPSLHSHCVTAAIRYEFYGRYLYGHWDIYALLRRQYKPAELIVFPEAMHNLSRPGERMTSLQGNVDWYKFWLKGEESPRREDSGQNERWRQLAQLKRDSDKATGCAERGPIR